MEGQGWKMITCGLQGDVDGLLIDGDVISNVTARRQIVGGSEFAGNIETFIQLWCAGREGSHLQCELSLICFLQVWLEPIWLV